MTSNKKKFKPYMKNWFGKNAEACWPDPRLAEIEKRKKIQYCRDCGEDTEHNFRGICTRTHIAVMQFPQEL